MLLVWGFFFLSFFKELSKEFQRKKKILEQRLVPDSHSHTPETTSTAIKPEILLLPPISDLSFLPPRSRAGELTPRINLSTTCLSVSGRKRPRKVRPGRARVRWGEGKLEHSSHKMKHAGRDTPGCRDAPTSQVPTTNFFFRGSLSIN